MAHAARLISHNKERVPKSIRTANTAAGAVERRDFPRFDAEVDAACLELAARGRGESAAILGRTTGVLRAVEASLKDLGIPYQGGLGGDFWSAGMPGVVHGLIGAIAGKRPTGITTALSVRGMNSRAVHNAREHILGANGKADALLASGSWLAGLGDDQVAIWQGGLRDELAAVLRAAPGPRAEFAKVCTDFVEPGVGDFTTDKIIKVVHKAIAELPGSLADLYQRIEAMKRGKVKEERTSDAIMLLTLHGSKGLEFDRVWMPAMRDGVLPHANSEIEEERRLAYVGMTRARRFLTVSYSRVKGAPESRFLREGGLPGVDAVQRRAPAN